MKTSLNEIELEKYVVGTMSPQDKVIFEQRVSKDAVLASNMQAQRGVYRIVKLFQREKTRRQLDLLHHRLMQDESFRNHINKIFISN